MTAAVHDLNEARSALNYALRYALLGWHVLPLDPGTKKPLGRLARNGFHDATIDEQQIRSWWGTAPEAGVGIALKASGLVAVDIDPRNGGLETMERLEAQHGAIVSDVLAYTGGGGEHRVFAAALVEHLPGKLGPGVDLKADGYIAVEPTIHPSGKPYAWETSSDPLDGVVPSTLPAWIRDMSRHAPAPAAPEVVVIPINPQRLRDVHDALQHIPADDRETWVQVGQAINNEMPGHEGFALWDAWSQQSPKYDAQDLLRVWRSFKPRGLAGVGLNTVFKMAQDSGWKNQGPAVATTTAEPAAGLPLVFSEEITQAAIRIDQLVEDVITLPDLDPQKRAQLTDRAQAYRLHLDQQDELRRARAQREADAALKRAEASFTTFQALADKGGVLDPAYIDRVTRETAGTPYQAGVLTLAKQAVETGGFASQPLPAQRAALQALDSKIATEGRNPALDKQREKLARVVAAAEKDAGDDPLSAALERGVVTQIEPLSMAGGVAGLVQKLGARSQQAALVETWAGRPVSPLLASEADTVSGMLRSMPPDQKATALQALAATMPPKQAQALARQLDKSDGALGLALAYGSAQTSFDRPVSELILRGHDAIKSKAVKLEDAAETGLTASFDRELGGAIPNPQQAAQVREAAKFIWAGKAAEGQRIDPANAVRLAVGGTVAEHNGARVILPAGMDESALRQRLSAYPADALGAQLPDGKVYVRGQAVDAAQFLAALPGAQLRTLARGRFAVVSGGAVATNAQMQPIVLEVR